MRRCSSYSLQFLATTMSLGAPYRGGRGRNQYRRGFSDRTSDDGRDQFITGDSHFRSVRDSNQTFRPPMRESFNHRPSRFNGRVPQSRFNSHPPPSNYQPRQFNSRPPPFDQSRSSRPLGFNQNQQQFRPRPQKPLDYRNWECARTLPPPDCERFTVLSYNILADYLAIDHRSKLYFHIPRHILDWEWRKRSIIFELGLWSADILCFQEVDRFQDLEEELKVRGFCGIWKMRTGNPLDGCAIFWRSSRFKLLHEESIEFNKLGLRDNVAQICVLESMNQKDKRYASAFPASSAGYRKVVICNIHVLYNPKRGEIKLGQSPLYNFISEQKIDLSELPRDKLSGQASAEIRGSRSFSPYFRTQSLGAPTMVDDREVGLSKMTPLDVQKQNDLNSNRGNLTFTSSLTGHDEEDVRKDEIDLNLCGASSCLDGSQGGCSIDQKKDAMPESPTVHSRHEDIYSNVITTGHGEELYRTSNGSHGSSTERHLSNLCDENEILNCEKGSDNDDSTVVKILHEPASTLNLDISSSELVHEASLNNVLESELRESSQDMSSKNFPSILHEIEIPIRTTSINFLLDEKIEDKSPNKIFEATENGTLDEDCTSFLSKLHNSDISIPSDFDQYPESSSFECIESSEYVAVPDSRQLHPPSAGVLNDYSGLDVNHFNVERTTYDPSAWTPMEIETATGSSDCTLVEHHLNLRSSYSEVEDSSGTRDSNGEPLVTSYNRCFLGTVDYIWHSEGLQTVRVLAPIPKHAMQWTPGFPTKKWGSDHIALVSEMAFTKDVTNKEDVR